MKIVDGQSKGLASVLTRQKIQHSDSLLQAMSPNFARSLENSMGDSSSCSQNISHGKPGEAFLDPRPDFDILAVQSVHSNTGH